MAITHAAAKQEVPTSEYARLEERIMHTAGHRKYGDSLEAYRRFGEALELAGC